MLVLQNHAYCESFVAEESCKEFKEETHQKC